MKPQRIFLEFDKAGAEWVVVAYLSGDANMISVCESGESPHVHTGFLMTAVPKPIIMKEHKLLGASTDPVHVENIRREHLPELTDWQGWIPRSMSIRQMAKKSNHALNYDMTYTRAALEWEVEENEAKRIIELYHKAAYPGVRLWHELDVVAALRRDRTLVNLLGRKYVFRDAWGHDLFKEAYAFVPQSTIFDLVRDAMIEIYLSEDKLLYDQLEMLTQTHDSFLNQLLMAEWREAALAIHKIVSGSLGRTLHAKGRDFKIGTEVKIGPNWGHMEPVSYTPDIDVLALRAEEAWGKAYASTAGQQKTAA